MVSFTSGVGGDSSGTLGPSPEAIVRLIESIVGPVPGLLEQLTSRLGGNVPTAGTPQLPGFDLDPFLARNREAGGINALLADALSANLAPAPPVQPFGGGLGPFGGSSPGGLFGLGNREPNNPGERPRPGGGSLASLAGLLAAGPFAPAAMLGGLTANDALGNAPSTSVFGAVRSLFDRDRNRGDRPDRGRVSRPDRVRSSSNREAGGGFTE